MKAHIPENLPGHFHYFASSKKPFSECFLLIRKCQQRSMWTAANGFEPSGRTGFQGQIASALTSFHINKSCCTSKSSYIIIISSRQSEWMIRDKKEHLVNVIVIGQLYRRSASQMYFKNFHNLTQISPTLGKLSPKRKCQR